MSQRQNDFRKWIEAGFRDYGKDPWFFIRELAQNSRDAGARNIHVKIGYTAKKEEALVFQDDGLGMSFQDAEKYLFRLYASSKTGEKNAAGMFGIGFWTVLKFNPSSVIIESKRRDRGKSTGNGSWGVRVEVGKELVTIPFDTNMKFPGTRVTLVRPAMEGSEKEFFRRTRDALKRYCTYLRSKNRNGGPLPVYFGGEDITRPMELPGPVSLSFRNGDVEGAVGLAPQPEVRLYARGLPVWRGTTLRELSHEPPQNEQTRDFGQGLAPVFLLNGNRLEVNISRRKVIDNRHLRRLRKSAENALLRMVETASDMVSPRTLARRLTDRFKGKASGIFRSMGKSLLLLLLVLVPLEIFLLKTFYKPALSSAKAGTKPVTGLLIPADRVVYTGASVKNNTPVEDPGFIYSPPRDRWFKVFYADRYTLADGFRQSSPATGSMGLPLPAPASGEMLNVRFNIRELRPVFLPQPVGFVIDPEAVTLAGAPVNTGALGRRPGGEMVFTPERTGLLRYTCRKPADHNLGLIPRVTAARIYRYTQLPPGIDLPAALADKLNSAREGTHTLVQKINIAIDLTAALLQYDDSGETAERYDRLSAGQRNWFSRVVEIGAGDCDIINGVTVLFLRKMAIPARLVIGMVGRRGRILPLLHAWTEYFDADGRRWIIDASALTSRRDGGQPAFSADRHFTQPGTSPGIRFPDRPVPSNGGRDRPMISRPLALYGLVGASVLLLVLLFLLVSREFKKPPKLSPTMLSRVERDLAGMALHALLHPNQVHNDGIRDMKLIPTLNRGPISIRDALKLSAEQKLFTAAAGDPVFAFLESSKRRVPVPLLDAGNPAFAPLIKLLPGAVHLGKVAELKAIDPEKAQNTWPGQLTARANRFFRELGVPMPPCWLAGGPMREDFLDADLSPLPRLPHWLLPNRCIIVNPNSRHINSLAALFQQDEALALLRFIQLLLKTSRLAPEPAEPVLQKASRKLLEQL